ncbi:MAG TPA: hypothetical protein VH420_05060 [Gaiellaceae bacterium]|jgi:hypothetical protein
MALRAAAICGLLLIVVAGCGGGGGGGDKSSNGTQQESVCAGLGDVAAPRATKAPWNAPENPMALTCAAGLVPEKAEFLQYHVHSHLDVFVDGRPIFVPAGIGIDLDDPDTVADTSADGLVIGAGLRQECSKPCISPLHTHDLSGLLHTETKTPSPNKLGQFFTQWAIKLTPDCVGAYCKPKTPIKILVDGKAETGDPREIELSNLREIAILIGKPPATIPMEFPR